MNVFIRCICGQKNKVPASGKKVTCRACGAGLRIDGIRPVVSIPEDSIDERKKNGKRIILRRPQGHIRY